MDFKRILIPYFVTYIHACTVHVYGEICLSSILFAGMSKYFKPSSPIYQLGELCQLILELNFNFYKIEIIPSN